jgi:hypothetical protein
MDSTTNPHNTPRDKGILLLLNALLVAHLAYGWKYFQPQDVPAPLPTRPMPSEPQLFDWQAMDLFAARKPANEGAEAVNPFTVAFVFPEGTKEPDKTETPPTETPPPPSPPPPQVVTITFNGVYVSLTGRVYALMEVSDSKTGTTASQHLTADKELPGGIRIAEINADWIDLTSPDGATHRIDFSRQIQITIPQKNDK